MKTLNRICLVFVVVLLASCTLNNPAPTPTPPPTLTPSPQPPTATPVPTISHSPTPPPTVPPTPTPAISALREDDGRAIYVRVEPSNLSDVVRAASDTTPVLLVGRSDDSRWLQVEFSDGSGGWVRAAEIEGDDVLDALDVTADGGDRDPVAIVKPDGTTALRDGPDEGLESQTDLDALTPLRVNGRLEESEDWLRVEVDDAEGWVNVADVDVFGMNDELEVVARADAMPPVVFTGLVREGSGGLRLRQLPNTEATILINLDAGKTLTLIGRSSDGAWLQIETEEGFEGWVASGYVDFTGNIDLLPINANPEPAPVLAVAAPPPESAPSVTTVTGGARQIYLRGQEMGNRRNVFSKVGDSLTDTPYFLREIVYGYNLRDYGYLAPTVQFFSQATALSGNSFSSQAISSRAGWSTFSALDPVNSDGGRCNPGETPVACEFRVVKPAVALIMIGTNDTPAFGADQYRTNMTQIIDEAIAAGVVPVLSTLPPRAQHNDNVVAYNQVVAELSRTYDVPMWDLYSALVNLPNRGVHPDGVHLSIPPGAPGSTVDFTEENLTYGTTMKNLTALQTLQRVLNEVMY